MQEQGTLMAARIPNTRNDKTAYGLIVAGGSGTRLWPLSRADTPKQFLTLDDGPHTLLQSTFLRLSRSIDPRRIKVVTSLDHTSLVLEQLRPLCPDYPERNVLGEPVGKNSAPAVLWGALHTSHQCPRASIAVVWSDQHIGKESRFDTGLGLAMKMAREGRLAAIGVTPTRPETGLGYIQWGEPIRKGAYTVRGFMEKPDRATARRYVKDGGYAWNAGIFAFNVQTLLEEYARHAPAMMKVFRKHGNKLGNKQDSNDWSGPALMEAIYGEVKPASIDTLLLEKTGRLCVIPCDLDWSDLGAWDVMYERAKKDRHGNAVTGNAVTIATRNSMVRAGKRLIATVGVENLIVVDTEDALLICDMTKVQDVKLLVDRLKTDERPEALHPATIVRPWGAFTVLWEGEGYKVKVIEVMPGHKLSLQKHGRRAEHWVVVEGRARVTCGEETLSMAPNDACHIPKGKVHRIENTGRTPLRFIEVQFGEYLGEDDIERLEDVYGRG